MKLRQENSVEEYQDEFEDMRIRLERLMPKLEESYFLFGFIGGLKDKIRLMVKMMKPVSLSEAVEVAKLQVQLLDKDQTKGGNSNSFRSFRNTYPNTTTSNQTAQTNPTNTYTEPYQAYPYPPRPPNTDQKTNLTANKGSNTSSVTSPNTSHSSL